MAGKVRASSHLLTGLGVLPTLCSAGCGMIGKAAAFGEGEQLEDATWAQRTRQQLEEEGGGEVQLHMETGSQGEQG